MSLATCLAGLCLLAHTGLSNIKGLSQLDQQELKNELKAAGREYGINSAEDELLDLLTAGDEPYDPFAEEETSDPSEEVKSPSWIENMVADEETFDDNTFSELSEPEPEPHTWKQTPTPQESENGVPLNVPLKSIEEIKSMLPIKSIEEIKSITPIKSIEEIKSMQEIKSILPVPDDIARQFIANHGLVSNIGGSEEETLPFKPQTFIRPHQNKNVPIPFPAPSGPPETSFEEYVTVPKDALLLIEDGLDMIQEALKQINLNSGPTAPNQDPIFDPGFSSHVGSFDPSPPFSPPPVESENPSLSDHFPGEKIKSVDEVLNMEEISKITPVKKLEEIVSMTPLKSVKEVKAMYELTDEQAEMLRMLNKGAMLNEAETPNWKPKVGNDFKNKAFRSRRRRRRM